MASKALAVRLFAIVMCLLALRSTGASAAQQPVLTRASAADTATADCSQPNDVSDSRTVVQRALLCVGWLDAKTDAKQSTMFVTPTAAGVSNTPASAAAS